MKAYVISEVEVLDESTADDYRRLAAASIAGYGGRYLARGAKAEVVEGDPTRRRIIIVEFPSPERAYEWYASPAYAEALRYREKALDRRLTFVEGTAPSAVSGPTRSFGRPCQRRSARSSLRERMNELMEEG